MSRNKREGRYFGKHSGRHMRMGDELSRNRFTDEMLAFFDACDVQYPIAAIVDRHMPPDNRNEVIDHDIRGQPITRGMVATWSLAKIEDDRKAQIKRNGGKR